MLEQRIEQQFIDSADLKYQAAQVLSKPIASAIQAILACVTSGGKVLVCGNGGSAADAQHFAAEFVGRFERERPELGAIALTTDSSILTAIGNDYDFDQIFSKQVRALGQSGDVLLAISTSGNSKNILKAIESAHQREMTVVALTGKGGAKWAPVSERRMCTFVCLMIERQEFKRSICWSCIVYVMVSIRNFWETKKVIKYEQTNQSSIFPRPPRFKCHLGFTSLCAHGRGWLCRWHHGGHRSQNIRRATGR